MFTGPIFIFRMLQNALLPMALTLGTLREPDIVMASSDVIANDAVGLALLKTLGTVPKIQNHSVWAQPQIKRAVELNLGVHSREEITVKSAGVEEIEEIIANLT